MSAYGSPEETPSTPAPDRTLRQFLVLRHADGRCGCCDGKGEHRCGSECTSCDGGGTNPDSPVCNAKHGPDCNCVEIRPIKPRIRVLTWDWREPIAVEELRLILAELGVYLREITTDSDQYAVALSGTSITQAEADEAYRRAGQ